MSNKYIGKTFIYAVNSGETRKARCVEIQMNHSVGKPLFIGKTVYGNTVKLTRDEIIRFL